MTATQQDAAQKVQGYDYYTPGTLRIYDLYVLGFNNRFVWRCPTYKLRALFARLATPRHCDIGVGSGYFLKHQQAKAPFERLHLVDASAATIERVRRMLPDPAITSDCTDVSKGMSEIPEPVTSVSLNYLFHCMAGPVDNKEAVLAGLKNIAVPGAAVFGSTIVNDPKYQGRLARRVLAAFNKKGIFDTSDDSAENICKMLNRHMDKVHTTMCGSVLIFEGHVKQGV